MPDFEPLHGVVPDPHYSLPDRHPNGRILTMSVTVVEHGARECAAVWDAETGRLLHAPDRAVALCWRAQGSELLVLKEDALEARRWPDDELLGQCRVSPPTGWLVGIAASPTGPLAAYRWQEQHCSGIEFVDLDRWEPTRLRYRGGVMLEDPVFSPDGRFVVLSQGEDGFWWSPDGEPDTPAVGGPTRAGAVIVGDLQKETFEERSLLLELKPAWLPDEPENLSESQWIPPVVFLDRSRFQVRLPTGEKRELSLPS